MDIQHLAEDFRRALLAARGLVHDLERGESPPTPMMVPAAALPSFEFAEDHVRQYLDDLEQELTAAVTSLPSTPLGIGFVDEDPAEFERVLASVRESLQSASGCLKRVREVLHVG
ncbi:MAG TPA: hypothetical protein VFZ09_01275 [Archangium sp.]|uniref:hypothetical protein n=1 Tax=Archangium sp. TaxID=1872627 RepID=UPI002E381A77|nr:hypothetical protein [Archangium sp.]HEX5744840.1 hypothetical protein [Archangium sp.]